MENEKSVEEIINGVVTTSPAEQARGELQSIRSLNLVSFIDAQLKKATVENELKELVTKKIKDIVNSEKEIDIMSLTHLLGVLGKVDNEFLLGIVSTVKDFYQIEKENETKKKNLDDLNLNSELTSEDMRGAKKVYDFMRKMSISEFPEKGE